jgi:2-oxoglutarate/2-oxoacid ferredoxin oxidoreductase subunit alpha
MGERKYKSNLDFIIRIGGEGGDGVISCGELFAKAAARTEYHVFTYITYPAEMRGGFSMIQIRVQDWTIYSMGSKVDYLVVFDQRAYDRSIEDLNEGGMIIYDPEHVKIDDNLKADLYPIPFTQISMELTGVKLGKNLVALGALGNLFKVKKKVLEHLIIDRYGKKGKEISQNNLKLLSAGFETGKKNKWSQKFHLSINGKTKNNYMMLSGNEAVALGALAAGCRFVAGYPITPATPIFETLTRLMPTVGGKAIQVEDEIAAISTIIGASFTGEKAITPTSGPGLQLMGEQLNLASMLELPIVIVDVQRGGPSTGLPTKTEQSDLKFAIYGTFGEAPRIVLAPTSVEDCFYQTIRAFNLAERFQMPVIMLTDQSIGYRKATVRIPDLKKMRFVGSDISTEKLTIPSAEKMEIAHRFKPTKEELKDYQRYKITKNGISPISSPGTLEGQYLATGLEHNEKGKVDYTPQNHKKMTQKRFKKLSYLSEALEKNPKEYFGSYKAKIGIIGWGSTMGAIREARYLAEKRGIKVRQLHPKIISPLPEHQIRLFLIGLKQVLVVEENYTGQFAHFLRAKFGITPVEIHKYEGIPITPEEVFAGIAKVARIIDEENITRL